MDRLDRLFDLELREVYVRIVDVIRDPASNPTAFALVLAAFSAIVILVILGVVLFFLSQPEEYEEEPGAGREPGVPRAMQAPPKQLSPEELEALESKRRRRRLVTTVAWALVAALVWVGGGAVSRRDTLCVSCHVTAGIHAARADDPSSDPHGGVRCVSCHESSNIVVSVTTAVPGRAFHFLSAAVRGAVARGYGRPVTNSACAGCHRVIRDRVVENPDRGLKMSHAEPLEAGARCMDCHAPRAESGIVNRLTVGMVTCIRCHDEKTAPAACQYCHTKDVSLAAQVRGEVKPQEHAVVYGCGGCHAQDTCDACHGVRLPHPPSYSGPGHARAAVEDIWYNGGRTCGKCHTETRRPCSNCHKGRFPGHAPSYMINGHKTADPYNNGCDGCHAGMKWIEQRNFCGNCHEEYAVPGIQ